MTGVILMSYKDHDTMYIIYDFLKETVFIAILMML